MNKPSNDATSDGIPNNNGQSGGVGIGTTTSSSNKAGGGTISNGSGIGSIGGLSTGERHPTLVHRKVALLGCRAVGKSSIVNSFVSGTFSESYHPTIESTFHKTIRFRKVHFQTDLVDTAGMVSLITR